MYRLYRIFNGNQVLIVNHHLIRKPHLHRYAVALQFPVVGVELSDDGGTVFFREQLSQYACIIDSTDVLPLERDRFPQYHLRRGSLVDIPLCVVVPVHYPLALVVEFQYRWERYGRIDLSSIDRYRELERFRRIEYKLVTVERMYGRERLKFGKEAYYVPVVLLIRGRHS